jgi:hypothetical protein
MSELALQYIPLSYNIVNPLIFPKVDIPHMLLFVCLPMSYLFAVDSLVNIVKEVDIK